jgi:hypothetical protein
LNTQPFDQLPRSWCLDAYLALHDLNLTSWWTVGLPEHLKSSPSAFKREIKKSVRLLDMQEWRTTLSESVATASDVSFCARAHYFRIKLLYGREPYLDRGDRKSSLFKFHLRSGNFGLYARTQHGQICESTRMRKACKFCPGHVQENEEHFLLHCTAYERSRRILWLNIEGNLHQSGLFNEWRCFHLAPDKEKVEYLLGRGEAVWHPEALMTIDLFVRQCKLLPRGNRYYKAWPPIPPCNPL